MLTIGEQLLLLALHDEKGTVLFSASTALPYGLAGATLLDLYFGNRIDIIERRVHVIDDAPTGDEVLDEALQLIQSSGKIRELKHWVSRINDKVKDLKGRLADSLVQRDPGTRGTPAAVGVSPEPFSHPKRNSRV